MKLSCLDKLDNLGASQIPMDLCETSIGEARWWLDWWCVRVFPVKHGRLRKILPVLHVSGVNLLEGMSLAKKYGFELDVHFDFGDYEWCLEYMALGERCLECKYFHSEGA